MRPSKEQLMMGFAVMASRMSTCQRLHVGCVLCDERFEQIAFGYNGTFKGGPNSCLHPGEPGGCGCVHAETNAVIKARFVPYHAFVTDSPCPACASALINAGIRHAHYAREYRKTEGIDLMQVAGVLVECMEPAKLASDLGEGFTLDVTASVYGWRLPGAGNPLLEPTIADVPAGWGR